MDPLINFWRKSVICRIVLNLSLSGMRQIWAIVQFQIFFEMCLLISDIDNVIVGAVL